MNAWINDRNLLSLQQKMAEKLSPYTRMTRLNFLGQARPRKQLPKTTLIRLSGWSCVSNSCIFTTCSECKYYANNSNWEERSFSMAPVANLILCPPCFSQTKQNLPPMALWTSTMKSRGRRQFIGNNSVSTPTKISAKCVQRNKSYTDRSLYFLAQDHTINYLEFLRIVMPQLP